MQCKIVFTIQAQKFHTKMFYLQQLQIISLNMTDTEEQTNVKISSILNTFAFPNNVFHVSFLQLWTQSPIIWHTEGKWSKTLNTINNNPLLTSDKLRKLLISKKTRAAMLYCSGESVLSAFLQLNPYWRICWEKFNSCSKLNHYSLGVKPTAQSL